MVMTSLLRLKRVSVWLLEPQIRRRRGCLNFACLVLRPPTAVWEQDLILTYCACAETRGLQPRWTALLHWMWWMGLLKRRKKRREKIVQRSGADFFRWARDLWLRVRQTALVESVTHQDSSTCDDVCRFCPCADFVKEEYTFGRGETCDYSFESHGGRMNAHFLAISKTHFRIFRVRKPPFCAFLTPLC